MPTCFTRREALQLLGGSCLAGNCAATPASSLSFRVFGLLAPERLAIRGFTTARLHCSSGESDWILEPGQSLLVDCASVPVRVSGPEGKAVSFVLETPGVLRREYHGTLEVRAEGTLLIPVVSMDIETAVNSIVGAELPSSQARIEALAAQAVVARSFLAGTLAPRHREAFFCDTTHCQFLRSPADDKTSVSRAVTATSGLVLTGQAGVFPARYSAACGGFTRGGERDGYSYRSIACEICRRQHSPRRGHGWGLCQEGAMGLAGQGRPWRSILAEYYPDACARTAG